MEISLNTIYEQFPYKLWESHGKVLGKCFSVERMYFNKREEFFLCCTFFASLAFVLNEVNLFLERIGSFKFSCYFLIPRFSCHSSARRNLLERRCNYRLASTNTWQRASWAHCRYCKRRRNCICRYAFCIEVNTPRIGADFKSMQTAISRGKLCRP